MSKQTHLSRDRLKHGGYREQSLRLQRALLFLNRDRLRLTLQLQII